jgi:hypothetical protein
MQRKLTEDLRADAKTDCRRLMGGRVPAPLYGGKVRFPALLSQGERAMMYT